MNKSQRKALWQTVAAGTFSFMGTCSLTWMLKLGNDKLGYTNSIAVFFLFLGLFMLLKKALHSEFAGKRRRWALPVLSGFGFSFCMVAGTQLDDKESVPFTNLFMWINILMLTVLFAICIRYFWDILNDKKPCRVEEKVQKGGVKSWLITAGVILLCYIPVFLAVYPGFFVYDAQSELAQVAARDFTTHHPLIHVLLLGAIVQFGHKVSGSYNVGIAMYTVFQMIVMSGIFAWCVEKLKRRGMGKAGSILLTLYFGLCPVLVMFSLCSAKDGLFTGMLLIAVVLLQELCKDTETFLTNKFKLVMLAGTSLGMMLLRHNGFYAFLVFSLFLVFWLKKYRKKIAVYLFAVFLIYGAVNVSLTWLLHADNSENQEILTVPISQMARVYVYEGERIPTEEKEILFRYLSEDVLDKYTPKVSDIIKANFNNQAFSEDKAGFFRLWAKWGVRYPFTYLNAWFMTSYGYWYPDTVIDVYRGNEVFTFTYEDSSYFGYEVEEPGFRESKIPWLDEVYRKMSLEIFQQKIPVVSMLFSPGFLFWVMMFMLGFFCYTKQYGRAMPFLLPVLCWLTVILGPTYLVRYVVFLWVLVPVLLWEVLAVERQQGSDCKVEK